MNKKNNCKILVCCHKRDIYVNQYPYLPIQVGKALSSIDLEIQGDDTGENISALNENYCELTGMYWAWKNLKDADVVGLCHYRRYFDFHKQCRKAFPYTSFPTSSFDSVDISIPEAIIDKVKNGTIVIPEPNVYAHNLMADYCIWHNSDDFRVLKQVFLETQVAEYQEAFFKVFYQQNKLISCNMFLMRWQDFDSYCSWLFFVLKLVEDKIDISHYSPVQRRIFGYMSERLLNVWLTAKHLKTSPTKVILFDDKPDPLAAYSSLKYWARKNINNLGMAILKPRKHEF